MRILLVSATIFEIETTINWLRARATSEQGNCLLYNGMEVQVLCTGVGMMATAFALGQQLASGQPPNLAIQAGIGGAIDRSISLGDVVRVSTETMGDLGSEAPDGRFLSLAEIGLPAGFPFNQREALVAPTPSASLPFREVNGLTVNKVTGSAAGVAHLRKRFPEAQVESMEGAAFFYACLRAGVEPLQLRAISNYVEVRQREHWKMKEAVEALNSALQRLLGPFLKGREE